MRHICSCNFFSKNPGLYYFIVETLPTQTSLTFTLTPTLMEHTNNQETFEQNVDQMVFD